MNKTAGVPVVDWPIPYQASIKNLSHNLTTDWPRDGIFSTQMENWGRQERHLEYKFQREIEFSVISVKHLWFTEASKQIRALRLGEMKEGCRWLGLMDSGTFQRNIGFFFFLNMEITKRTPIVKNHLSLVNFNEEKQTWSSTFLLRNSWPGGWETKTI